VLDPAQRKLENPAGGTVVGNWQMSLGDRRPGKQVEGQRRRAL